MRPRFVDIQRIMVSLATGGEKENPADPSPSTSRKSLRPMDDKPAPGRPALKERHSPASPHAVLGERCPFVPPLVGRKVGSVFVCSTKDIRIRRRPPSVVPRTPRLHLPLVSDVRRESRMLLTVVKGPHSAVIVDRACYFRERRCSN